MAVLLLAEVNGADLAQDATAKAVTAAKSLGDVIILCASSGCSGAAEAAAKIDGVSKVLFVDAPVYGNGIAEPIADLIVSLAGHYEHILAPATNSAKNILPRVAALLDAMVISDITAVIDANTFERPIYAGNAIQTVQSLDAKKDCYCAYCQLRSSRRGRISVC
jgi:electron transfer flavoprotein alpha subunit